MNPLGYSPNLFCIAGFDLWPLLDKFGVLLDKFDPPLCMLLQVVKLILQEKKKNKWLDISIDLLLSTIQGKREKSSIMKDQIKIKSTHQKIDFTHVYIKFCQVSIFIFERSWHRLLLILKTVLLTFNFTSLLLESHLLQEYFPSGSPQPKLLVRHVLSSDLLWLQFVLQMMASLACPSFEVFCYQNTFNKPLKVRSSTEGKCGSLH